MDWNKHIEPADTLAILKDRLYWLKVNGFTEKGLHFPGKTGWLEDNIAKKYLRAVEAIRVHPVNQEFSQSITGFFNTQDLVHFVLRYQVDPENYALDLTGLTARLGENRKTILFHTPMDLIPASEIYSLLIHENTVSNSLQKAETFKIGL